MEFNVGDYPLISFPCWFSAWYFDYGFGVYLMMFGRTVPDIESDTLLDGLKCNWPESRLF